MVLAASACSLLLGGPCPTFADDNTSAANSGSSSGSGKGTVLHSSLQDQENMQSSVKLLLAPPPAPKPQPSPSKPLQSNVEQLSGDAVKGGKPLSGGANSTPLNGGIFKAPPQILPTRIVPTRIVPFFRPAPPVKRWNYTATPRNGTMIWDPHYAIQKIPQPPPNHRNIGLSLDLPAPTNTHLQLSDPATSIRRIETPPAAPPPPAELKAVQFQIPEAKLPPPANWNEWYKRVAKAVYEQWKQKAIGPGKSTLTVTVFNTHNVDAKVVEFIPAEGTNRDAKAETNFRQASINSITNLDGLPLWEFPIAKPVPKKIAFDMEFDHIVGEPAGVQVIKQHAQ